MVDLCRHIKADGHRCGTPAVHGTLFCYHHSQRKTAIKKAKVALSLANPHMPIPFVFPEDRAAIQHNLYLVALALASKRISERTANTYTSIWRACRINLGKAPLVETDPDNTVRRVILTPEGDEITTPLQMLEKGETINHGPECPCGKCAGLYRNAPPERHHHDCRCGLCDESRPVPGANHPGTKPSEPADSIPALQAVGVPIDRSSSMGREAVAKPPTWVPHP